MPGGWDFSLLASRAVLSKVPQLLRHQKGTFERAFVLILSYLVISSAALILLDAGSSKASSSESPLDPNLFASLVLEQQGEPPVPQAEIETQAAAEVSEPVKTAPYRPPILSPTGRNISAYSGMGTWVDLYDWGKPGTTGILQIMETAAARGVKTMYLQTGRWNLPEDVASAPAIGEFIDRAHTMDMKVVAWYLPGFANLELDLHRSFAAINYVSPEGRKFDGFAPDIEDPRGVGRNMTAFNLGIMEYSRRLRESVPSDYALGAITLDARNNERAPLTWAGHPWPEIGQYYDIVLPMAYWTVTKPSPCLAHQIDVGTYMRDVVNKTRSLMGKGDMPVHPIGGIADCNTAEEVSAYMDVALEQKWTGASLYDLLTIEAHPNRDAIVQQLQRGNELMPKPPPPQPGPRQKNHE